MILTRVSEHEDGLFFTMFLMDSVQISPFILTAIIAARKVFIPSKVFYTLLALAEIQKLCLLCKSKKKTLLNLLHSQVSLTP